MRDIFTKRAPNPRASDRIIAGLCTLLMRLCFLKITSAFELLDWHRAVGSLLRRMLHFILMALSSLLAGLLHLSLDKDSPDSRSVQSVGRVIAFAEVGGLHHRYERVA
jgi:hypothetical protein